MRTMTISIPDNVTDEQINRAIDHASDEWLAIYWHISDIQSAAKYRSDNLDIPDDDAIYILRQMEICHDCNAGINWDVINYFIDEWEEEREVTA